MALSGNYGLSDQDLTADRAVLALGQAGCGTGGSLGGVDGLGVGMLRGGTHSLGKDHFSFRVKGIPSHRDGRAVGEYLARNKALGQVQSLIFCHLMAIVDEIQIILEENQLVRQLLYVVEVEIVADHTVQSGLDDHFALGVKLVVADLNRSAVGKILAAYVGCAQVQPRVLGDLVAIIDKVVIAILVLHQLIGLLSDAFDIEIILIGACQKFSLSVLSAIVIQHF